MGEKLKSEWTIAIDRSTDRFVKRQRSAVVSLLSVWYNPAQALRAGEAREDDRADWSPRIALRDEGFVAYAGPSKRALTVAPRNVQ